MAFKLSLSNTYWVSVEVYTPAEKGGFDKSTLDVEVARVSTNELLGYESKEPREVLLSVIKGWKGLERDGEELPFTQVNLSALLEVPQAVTAITIAFFKSVHKAREKNS